MDKAFAKHPALATQYPQCPAASSSKCDTLITYVKDRAGHDFRYAIDTQKIRDELEYQPLVTFERGIELTLDWYLNNKQWWNSVLDGSYRD